MHHADRDSRAPDVPTDQAHLVLRHDPQTLARARWWVGLKDYLLLWLTGTLVTELSSASGTGMLDLRPGPGVLRRLPSPGPGKPTAADPADHRHARHVRRRRVPGRASRRDTRRRRRRRRAAGESGNGCHGPRRRRAVPRDQWRCPHRRTRTPGRPGRRTVLLRAHRRHLGRGRRGEQRRDRGPLGRLRTRARPDSST